MSNEERNEGYAKLKPILYALQEMQAQCFGSRSVWCHTTCWSDGIGLSASVIYLEEGQEKLASMDFFSNDDEKMLKGKIELLKSYL